MSEIGSMPLKRSSPEILRRDSSYQWAERYLKRALDADDQHRARRAAMLTMALHKRIDEIVFSSGETYRDGWSRKLSAS